MNYVFENHLISSAFTIDNFMFQNLYILTIESLWWVGDVSSVSKMTLLFIEYI